MRTKKLAWNTISSLAFQLTSLICGFILPQLILHSYGSEVNGLVNSITQFLQVIALLELGVGAVIQSSLYKPLAEKDSISVSRIITSGSKFFKRIAQILIVYVIILMVVYPNISNQKFGHIYTTALIFAMSISSFAQYYFGVIDRLLLTADQRGYIQYIAQIITMIANTVAGAILIYLGCSIHIVKLVASIIFLVRPLFLRIYVNRHYGINRKAIYDEEPIKQKWNGIQALIGEMWAKKELEALSRFFGKVEWAIHTGVTFIFGCTAMLIVPFVRVYTDGIIDANYDVPLFAALLTLANAMHCLRLPYNILILAGGHYKQTQSNYIIAAVLNLVISVAMVMRWGLVGVAIGTLVAMGYQTIGMAYYDSKNLIRWPFKKFLKQLAVDCFSVVCGVMLTKGLAMETINYLSWIILAIKVAIIWVMVILIVNVVAYRENMKWIVRKYIKSKH